ncbi:hypothetical protein [Pseudorhodoplanes sp.]|uniref:hypothetical protein n=1 Tax=Pseudorhodoplanes sp. TaxID=1934341 RepID=UPI00391C198E
MLCAPEHIWRWAETAAPGQQESYGRGQRAPADLVAAMRPLVEAGVLTPVRKREGDNFLFMVQRGTGALPAAERRRLSRGPVRRKIVRRSELSRVFQCLLAAAVRNRPCPSLAQIARRCGLRGKGAAQYRVSQLVRKGRIAIEERGPDQPRIVTILTGRHAGRKTRGE